MRARGCQWQLLNIWEARLRKKPRGARSQEIVKVLISQTSKFSYFSAYIQIFNFSVLWPPTKDLLPLVKTVWVGFLTLVTEKDITNKQRHLPIVITRVMRIQGRSSREDFPEKMELKLWFLELGKIKKRKEALQVRWCIKLLKSTTQFQGSENINFGWKLQASFKSQRRSIWGEMEDIYRIGSRDKDKIRNELNKCGT